MSDGKHVPPERLTGAAMILGAVLGHVGSLATDRFGPEHTVALSLDHADLMTTFNAWLSAVTGLGGELPFALHD